MVDIWWDRSGIVAECLECEHEWGVKSLGEDCPECLSPNVLYMNSHWSDMDESDES